MARFILQNKVYDTEKMQHLGKVKKWYAFQGWLQQQIWGKDTGLVHDCDLYRSPKGNFLLLHEDDSEIVGEAIPESEAKELLLHSNYEKYAELYGPIEEA